MTRDHADKSNYRSVRAWSRGELIVLAYCAAYTLALAALDWLARGMT